jgi:hypothetical protein
MILGMDREHTFATHLQHLEITRYAGLISPG